MKSDRFLHFLGKYYTLMISVVLLITAIERYKNHYSDLTLASSILFGLAGLLLLISFFYSHDKFAVVELGDKGVALTGNDAQTIPWEKIQSIRHYRTFLTFVPYYKVKIVDSKDFIVFGTSLRFWNIGDQNISESDINKFIALKRGKSEFEEEF